MFNIAIIGGQWGDEGKGKVVDLLSDRFDVVARFQGGPNAGHTVVVGEMTHALHHIPSGVFRPDAQIVIGNGTVLDLTKLLIELEELDEAGVKLEGRLFISDRAHVILPVMQRLDAVREDQAGPSSKIGTTLRGIGPTYEAKAARWGIRMADLSDRGQLQDRLERILSGLPGREIREGGGDPGQAEEQARQAHEQWKRLEQFVTDTSLLLNDWIDEGKKILFEGAQGTLLDLDHGSYPFVTSSNTTAGGICTGLGIGPSVISGVLGVYKAYATRVGSGPMPTELDDADGQRLRDRGHEYGTTTGRPRRCGWFDGVAARYTNRINRCRGICLTLLDVLDSFEEIRICRGYRIDGRELTSPTASVAEMERVEPVYESHAGWNSETTNLRRWEDLPAPAIAYLDRIGEIIGTQVNLVGVGPERTQTLVRPGSWLAEKLGT
jgi:adenylosuccinate synthase